MPTQSFYEDLVLDTPEAIANLEAALDEANARGRLVTVGAHRPIEDEDELRALLVKWGYHLKSSSETDRSQRF